MTETNIFPSRFFSFQDTPQTSRLHVLGSVIGGSLTDGLVVRLNGQTVIEGLRVGAYIAIEGMTNRTFFGYITDIKLRDITPLLRPPDDKLRSEVYSNALLGCYLRVKLVLMCEGNQIQPVRSVPSHFTRVRRLTTEESRLIFSGEGAEHTHLLGHSLEDEHIAIRLDLNKLTERSTAVFGRSGTGKTFLTLPLLASIIRSDTASVLVFDMHNDYGYTLKGDDRQFHGLKRLSAIRDKVLVVTLDEESSQRRNAGFEFTLQIGLDEIEPEDLEMLQGVLSLSEVQVNTIHALPNYFGPRWIYVLAGRGVTAQEQAHLNGLLQSNLLNQSTFNAIQRKLNRILKLPFVLDRSTHAVQQIIDNLLSGRSVVVEFGNFGSQTAAYVLVSNLLTRRIHDEYVRRKEEAEGRGWGEPPRLVIVIEEAHKFLDPKVANLTTFGTIAREMRKYDVTLLIVDQRPSQIDREVMSQIGTRITCALSDEQDINAVLIGMGDTPRLKALLASLESRQQAMVMGHAVRVPVLVHTRTYDETVYAEYATPDDGLSAEARMARSQQMLGRPTEDDPLL